MRAHPRPRAHARSPAAGARADGKAYVEKNPQSTGCRPYITPNASGMALNYWNVDDDEFYAKEGKGIATRQLNISMPNLALGFGVWLMWSVICAKIQQVHTDDPSVYYFKEFSPSHEGGRILRSVWLVPRGTHISDRKEQHLRT